MESFNVAPSAQKLLYNGQYLKSNSSALWQLNISPGCLIFLLVKEFIILEVEDSGDSSEYLAETVIPPCSHSKFHQSCAGFPGDRTHELLTIFYRLFFTENHLLYVDKNNEPML